MSFRRPQSEPIPSQPDILSPILAACGLVVVIFAGYELAERLWLSELDPEWTHRLHLARGLISSLLATLLVGWLMYRASASLRATTLSTSEWIRGKRPGMEDRGVYYALWLIQLRWIAVIVATGLFIFVTAAGKLAEEAWWPVAGTIGALAVLNVGYASVTNQRWLNRCLLPVQAYADLAILGILLHFSGGIENPLWIAMVFNVAVAGIVLERRHCYGVAGMAALVFALVVGGEAYDVLDHYLLEIVPHTNYQGTLMHAGDAGEYVFSMIAVFTGTLFLVAYFVTALGDRIRNDESQLATLANRALTERQLLDQALLTTGTGLCVLDPDFNPLWKNTRWQAWFPEVPVETVRESLEESRESVTKITRNSTSIEDNPARDTRRIFQLTTGTLQDGESRIVVLAQEVTLQEQAQAQMVQAEKLAAVGEMAGHVAHEVNNPIGIISAKSRLLLSNRRTEVSEKVAEELVKITALSDRVAEITQGLLSYCRKSSEIRQPLDILVPVREAMSLATERARGVGVQIEERFDEPLPKVCANAKEIQQIIVNLLFNALDAMPDGGSIIVRAQAGPPACVTVYVEDSGVGMPPEIQASVFEPFFTTKPEGRGTGLGLSVCDGLIRSHGGSIEVESEPDHGTRITIMLPADCAQGGGK